MKWFVKVEIQTAASVDECSPKCQYLIRWHDNSLFCNLFHTMNGHLRVLKVRDDEIWGEQILRCSQCMEAEVSE
jgi:hypothetical protein